VRVRSSGSMAHGLTTHATQQGESSCIGCEICRTDFFLITLQLGLDRSKQTAKKDLASNRQPYN